MEIGDCDLFIFDWDGTLSTSTSFVRLSRFFKSRYSPAYILEHEKFFKAKRGALPSVRLEKLEEREFPLYSAVYELYALFEEPKLRIGSAELLRLLKKKGKRIAIFTDAKRYRVIREIRELGISRYVDFVLSADSIKAFKPDPTGILIIARRAGTPASKSVYVGDMASDVFTAKFAGVHSCGVGGGMNSMYELKGADPDFLFESIEEMKDAIKKRVYKPSVNL